MRAKAWAFWLLCALWSVQLFEYFSDSLYFSLVGPLSLRIGWGYESPPSLFKINLLAIALAILAAGFAKALAGQRRESQLGV